MSWASSIDDLFACFVGTPSLIGLPDHAGEPSLDALINLM